MRPHFMALVGLNSEGNQIAGENEQISFSDYYIVVFLSRRFDSFIDSISDR